MIIFVIGSALYWSFLQWISQSNETEQVLWSPLRSTALNIDNHLPLNKSRLWYLHGTTEYIALHWRLDFQPKKMDINNNNYITRGNSNFFFTVDDVVVKREKADDDKGSSQNMIPVKEEGGYFFLGSLYTICSVTQFIYHVDIQLVGLMCIYRVIRPRVFLRKSF